MYIQIARSRTVPAILPTEHYMVVESTPVLGRPSRALVNGNRTSYSSIPNVPPQTV